MNDAEQLGDRERSAHAVGAGGVYPDAGSGERGIRWRQPPQQVTRSAPSATVRTSTISRSPAATIAPIAFASAHVPSGNDAFSTLQPAYTRPERRAPRADREPRVRRVRLRPHGVGHLEQLLHAPLHDPTVRTTRRFPSEYRRTDCPAAGTPSTSGTRIGSVGHGKAKSAKSASTISSSSASAIGTGSPRPSSTAASSCGRPAAGRGPSTSWA